MSDRQAAIEYARSNKDRYLEELKAFLRIKSISTSPEHNDDMLTRSPMGCQ